ncbi:MAG: HK97 family phage prohead protease [Patescibacteria group bacterium]
MSGEHEIREYVAQEMRVDEGPDKKRAIVGYAAVFDQVAQVYDYDEVIRRGAFAKTISDGADVFAFWAHSDDAVLGRRKNGTLTLVEDDHGLRVSITPPDTDTAREVYTLIQGGFIDKMSFRFDVVDQHWTRKKSPERDLRELKELKLYEVSPVPLPAYEGTTVSARSKQPDRGTTATLAGADAPDQPSRTPLAVLRRKVEMKIREINSDQLCR